MAQLAGVRRQFVKAAMAAPFLILLVALWIRPWGIFGSKEELERI